MTSCKYGSLTPSFTLPYAQHFQKANYELGVHGKSYSAARRALPPTSVTL